MLVKPVFPALSMRGGAVIRDVFGQRPCGGPTEGAAAMRYTDMCMRMARVVFAAMWCGALALPAQAKSPAPETIYVCIPNAGGAARMIGMTAKCKASERKVSWKPSVLSYPGSIDGRLVSGCTAQQPGDPVLDAVAGYTVQVPGHAYLLRTGTNGEFHFDLVKPGTYDLVAEKDGRAPVSVGTVTAQAGRAKAVPTVVVACSVSCGDRVVGSNEQCDDGNTVNGDGCSSTCQTEQTCGNEIVGPGEACDGADLAGHSCQSLGFMGGQLACGQTCQFVVDACDVDDGNPCTFDSVDDNNVAHSPLPEGTPVGSCQVCSAGSIVPDPACQHVCGNAVADPGEGCDGADLNGQSCSTLGFTGGVLGCTAGCQIDTSGCTP